MKRTNRYTSLLLAVAFGLTVSLEARIIHVNSIGRGGDGSSWNLAYLDLQSALAVAAPGDEIHVAQGIYYPDEGTGQVEDDRSSTFQLKTGVTLLGGFRNDGENPAERDPVANPTILSGDIDQNDADAFSNDAGNAYHVVNGSGVDETAILDGFVITAGRADGSGSDRRGGGMYCNDTSSPTVRNCTFIGNYAEIGGGFYTCLDSSPRITNCSFIGNRAAFGGGMYNCINSAPVLINCLLAGNLSSSNGGAIYNDLNASSTYINCTFSGNRTERIGGAVYNTRNSSPQFINCIIWNNDEDGSTTTTGASVANDVDCFPVFTHSLVANSGGSADWNTALGTDNGGNLDADPRFLLDADPQSAPSTLGDFRLGPGSPAFNAGQNPDEPVDLDLQGDLRIQELVIDLGPYEGLFQEIPESILYVDASATGQATGESWEDAFSNLQDALQAAVPGDTLHVAEGTYYPDEGGGWSDNDRLATFRLQSGVALLGGFPVGGGDSAERNPAANRTVLSGDIDQDDGAEFANNSGNSFTVVAAEEVGSSAILDGFVITAGNADGTTLIETRGGGMFCSRDANPVLRNCTFLSNYGDVGGGLYICNNSFPEITNCRFVGNQSGYGGGLFICIGSSPTLANCAFEGNRARVEGGAVYSDLNTVPVFTNCTFAGNTAGRTGGAIYNTRSSSPEFINCLIWNNAEGESTTTPGASVANNDDSHPVFRNSLIAHSGGSTGWDPSIGIDDGNNIEADPLFVREGDPLAAPSTLGSYRLRTGSPALDAGDNGVDLPDTDLAGSSRIQETGIDLGAYEGRFTARFATFYPGLDPERDNNGNGVSNYLDYARGLEPLGVVETDAAPELTWSGTTLLLTMSQRLNVRDVYATWQYSPSLEPDSWSEMQEGTDYTIVSTLAGDVQQVSTLEVPASPDSGVYYRQIFRTTP